MKANCVVCGKEFEKRRSSKTCGDECSHKRNCERSRGRDRKYRAANPEKIREKRRNEDRFNAAAKYLGIPHLLYAAMKLTDRATQPHKGKP